MIASDATLGGLPIAAGHILLKKYRVERLIGEGGTGIVISATHVQLEQRVAIKFLRRALDSDELRTRFEREARAIGKIESDHVVLVLDAGALEDGAPYMVMEYLEGRDLARVLKEDGPLPIEQAVDCMLQVCEALDQAHANGIVHRDLKPANLFLTRRDDDAIHVKVVDFGISKILDKKNVFGDDRPHDVTSAFTMLGSPRYMAPEQVRNSKDVDGRADLWSVGAVLFQLLTGEYAFDADGTVRASVAVLTEAPRNLRLLNPAVPTGLEAVVMRCLTKDVDLRFQSSNELAEALRPYASDRAKESLDRLRSAKHELEFSIAIGAEGSSKGRRAVTPAVAPVAPVAPAAPLARGRRDVPTEPRMRVAAEPVATPEESPSAPVAVLPRAPQDAPRSSGRFAAIAIVLVLVAVGGLVSLRVLGPGRFGRSAGGSRSGGVASSNAGSPVPLDAGKATP